MNVQGTITYTRKRQIGVGQGMNSTVWLVDDPQLDGEFAVKEIKKRDLGNDLDRFWVEAQTMNAVGHPNVVPIRAAFQTSDLICLAMDYYRNGSLADKTLVGPLSLVEIIRVGEGILSGVSSIHAADYLHFDIKPSNVFFDRRNRPLVADFGQSRKIGPTGVTVRPAMYLGGLPPECYDGIGLQQSDVYQVGLTLYRAANGDDHFNSQLPLLNGDIDEDRLEQKTRRGKFPNSDSFFPHVPRALRTVIRKALRVNPTERYGSAADMADALGKVEFVHNWETTVSSGGEIQWRSRRLPEQPDIVVDLVRRSRKWDVEIHGERAGKLRKRSKDGWKDGLSLPEALKHLKNWFAAQE